MYRVLSRLMRSSAQIRARQMKTTSEPEATQYCAEPELSSSLNGSTVLELEPLKKSTVPNIRHFGKFRTESRHYLGIFPKAKFNMDSYLNGNVKTKSARTTGAFPQLSGTDADVG